MTEPVKISFEPSHENDTSPHVTIFNPIVLSFALRSQVTRFGLVGTADRKVALTGNLKGDRGAFTQMIQSYGHVIQYVRPGHVEEPFVADPS